MFDTGDKSRTYTPQLIQVHIIDRVLGRLFIGKRDKPIATMSLRLRASALSTSRDVRTALRDLGNVYVVNVTKGGEDLV